MPTEEKKTPESPYRVERQDGARRSVPVGGDKIPGDGVPSQEVLADFIAKTATIDVPEASPERPRQSEPPKTISGPALSQDPAKMRVLDENGNIVEVDRKEAAADEVFTEKTFQKVLAFLDPVSLGPVMLLPQRHKLFAVRIPTQQELLDVQFILNTPFDKVTMNTGEFQMSVIGELRKACFGWVPEVSQEAQTLRANISWREKWPKLRDISWQDTRDPYVWNDEIFPLYEKYVLWRQSVVPTRQEIDFYYANLK
jgi:hypothetical protein